MTFLDILNLYSIPFIDTGHQHCRKGWIQLDCPECTPNQKRWRLGYNIRGGYLNCWSCGRKNTVSVISKLSNEPYKVIKNLVSDISKFKLPPEIEVRGKFEFPPNATLHPLSESNHHIEYLKNRNLNWRKIEKIWEVKALTYAKELSWRLFIPILFRGELVSWTTRSITDSRSFRYISARPEQEKLNHKDILYGEDLTSTSIIIVEGPIDVWAIGPGSVCTFGTGYKRSQVLRISKYPTRYICYDSEPAAQKKAKELCNLLSGFPGNTFNVILDSGKDAGEASEKEIKLLRRMVR